MNRPRVVFSLTTLPSRINNLRPTLQSLNNQTISPDNIYLTIPRKCKRLGKKYPLIPAEITDICDIVYIEKDYGPITKILGALIKEKDPDTLIITVDDDITYPPNMIETFLKYHKRYPDSALGSSGLSLGGWFFQYSIKYNQKKNDYWFTMTVPSKGRPVDILYGYAGVLYNRSFFPSYHSFKNELLEIINGDKDLFRNDDVTLSFYLNREGIERRVVQMSEVVNRGGDDAISDGILKFFRSLQKAVKKCEAMGWDSNYEKVHISETFGCLFLILLILIIGVVLIYYSYYS